MPDRLKRITVKAVGENMGEFLRNSFGMWKGSVCKTQTLKTIRQNTDKSDYKTFKFYF